MTDRTTMGHAPGRTVALGAGALRWQQNFGRLLAFGRVMTSVAIDRGMFAMIE